MGKPYANNEDRLQQAGDRRAADASAVPVPSGAIDRQDVPARDDTVPFVEGPLDVASCVCFDLSFDEILRRCRRDGIDDLDGIRRALGCGSGCGLCTPYLANMLRTGRTRFRLDEGIV